MSKFSEIINANRENIIHTMIWQYRSVLEANGDIEVDLYIWEDGEIEALEHTHSDHMWLKPRDSEPRELYFVVNISHPFFDFGDYCSDLVPDYDEDPEGYEHMREETINWLVDDFNADEILDNAIDQHDEMIDLGMGE